MAGKRMRKSPAAPRKRARKQKDDEEEETADPTVNYHLQQDDDDEDVQAGYQEEGGTIIEGIYIPPIRKKEPHPQTGERLVIEKIVCENFKSYGGVKEMGPFHKSFSAIVGPNGNGKSNIIDAMLFVFGYRAAKIRCKKVSVLIHKSELLPNVESCAVTVHFVKIIDNGDDGTDDFEVVPNSQIRVLRRAYKDNSSAYWLANKRVKFQDVASFLNQNGIDIVHNRFLILQGEVESIAQMPPKSTNGHEAGLLEFLEEVIGSHRYIKCLSELNIMCDSLSYQREEKLQRVDLVEREKRSMAEPVKKAKDFLRDKNTQSRIQHTLGQLQGYNAKKKFARLDLTKQELDEKKNELQSRLEEIAGINKERHDNFETVEKAFRVADKQFNKSKKSMEEMDSAYIKLNQDIKRSNDQRKKLAKDLKEREAELEKQVNTPTNFKEEMVKLEKRKIELDVDIEKEDSNIEGDVQRVEAAAAVKSNEKQELERKFGSMKAERDAKKSEFEKASKDLEVYKSQEADARRILDQMETELKEIKENISNKEKQNRNSFGNKQLEKLTNELHSKRQRIQELSQSEVECRHELQKFRSQLEECKNSLQGGNTNTDVYKVLLAAKASGQAPGFRGKLKDIATIDEKYNVGATVATGFLEHWVADTDMDVTACIEILRKHNIGAQTFMTINKMKHHLDNSRRPFKAPSGTHRIFDLIKMNTPDLAAVFYKAYGNTLIAENLETANKVAYGSVEKFRVVSLCGAIAQSSGSMVGGGGKVYPKFNSGMQKVLNSKFTEKDVQECKAQVDSLQSKLEDIESEKQNLFTQTQQLDSELNGLKVKADRLNNDLKMAKVMVPMKEGMVKQQEEAVKAAIINPNVLKQKEKICASLEKELSVACKPHDEMESKINKLNKEILELRGEKIAKIRCKLDKYIEQRKMVVKELDKLSVDLKNATTNKNKLEKQIKTNSAKVKELEQSMTKMAEEKNKVEEKGKKLKEELNVATEKLSEIQEEYNKQKATVSELDSEEKKLNKKKMNLENDIINTLKEMKTLDLHIKDAAAKLEGITLDQIPEEEVEPLRIFTDEEMERHDSKDLKDKLNKVNNKLSKEVPNLNILDEYKKKVDQFLQRVQELDEITARRDKVREQLVLTSACRLREFMEAFVQISSKLTEMFRMISMGGDAELTLVDNVSPFTSGIEFSVRPARKTWKKISNLSGGEKTLSSLALVFALHYYKPSPFYVMDEIDAALDFKNVSIIANYIKDRTKFTQFIIISLRSNMFELADSLLGVYKVDNMSYSIHIGVRRLLTQLKNKAAELKQPGTQTNQPETQANNEMGEPSSQRGLLNNNLSAILDGESEVCVTGNQAGQESDEELFQNSQLLFSQGVPIPGTSAGSVPIVSPSQPNGIEPSSSKNNACTEESMDFIEASQTIIPPSDQSDLDETLE